VSTFFIFSLIVCIPVGSWFLSHFLLLPDIAPVATSPYPFWPPFVLRAIVSGLLCHLIPVVFSLIASWLFAISSVSSEIQALYCLFLAGIIGFIVSCMTVFNLLTLSSISSVMSPIVPVFCPALQCKLGGSPVCSKLRCWFAVLLQISLDFSSVGGAAYTWPDYGLMRSQHPGMSGNYRLTISIFFLPTPNQSRLFVFHPVPSMFILCFFCCNLVLHL